MTVDELIEQLQEIVQNPEYKQLEVLFDDTIATTPINKVYVALADEDNEPQNTNTVCVCLARK